MTSITDKVMQLENDLRLKGGEHDQTKRRLDSQQ